MDLLEAVWARMISDEVRNVFVMAGCLRQGAEPPVCATLLKPPPLLPNPGPGACGVNQ